MFEPCLEVLPKRQLALWKKLAAERAVKQTAV
jgi:hypothetical protein